MKTGFDRSRRVLRSAARVVALLAVTLGGGAVLAAATVTVPLREGLTLVEAYRNASGDFETITTVTRVDASGIALTASTDEAADTCSRSPSGGAARRSWGLRSVLREDLENARALQHEWAACPAGPEVHPGTTAISVSTRVLRELEARGQTPLNATTSVAGMMSGVLTRLERTDVPFEVVVNDQPAILQAVHARWESKVGVREYWILDDPANPLVLRGSYMGRPFVEVVRLSFPTDHVPSSAQVERDLGKTGRVTLYGIYFSSGSDRLRDESEPVLADIAAVLKRNPTWSVAVEGHTDNIGGEAYNLELSRRRSAAVKDALVSRYKIAAARLRATGLGASQPRDTNDTLQGRARNRRVELVRLVS